MVLPVSTCGVLVHGLLLAGLAVVPVIHSAHHIIQPGRYRSPPTANYCSDKALLISSTLPLLVFLSSIFDRSVGGQKVVPFKNWQQTVSPHAFPF